jgi:hypothetical protein
MIRCSEMFGRRGGPDLEVRRFCKMVARKGYSLWWNVAE